MLVQYCESADVMHIWDPTPCSRTLLISLIGCEILCRLVLSTRPIKTHLESLEDVLWNETGIFDLLRNTYNCERFRAPQHSLLSSHSSWFYFLQEVFCKRDLVSRSADPPVHQGIKRVRGWREPLQRRCRLLLRAWMLYIGQFVFTEMLACVCVGVIVEADIWKYGPTHNPAAMRLWELGAQ